MMPAAPSEIAHKPQEALTQHLAAKIADHGIEEICRNPSLALITYGELCNLAGNPVIPRGAGKYLTLLRQEAEKSGGLPLDCIVINQKTRQPGRAYWPDGRFGNERWLAQIRDAITSSVR